MKLKNLFDVFIETGIKNDPRSADAVHHILKERNEKFEKLPVDEKEFFDRETLTNPYADTRILNGTGDEEISTIIVGIDMEVGEILLADRLRSQGKKIDLVLTHHPEGGAYANFYRVIDMQTDILNTMGVPITVAESMVGSRLKEVGRKVLGANHFRTVDAAKLLQLPFAATHTVADNQVATYLQKIFDDRKPRYISEIVKMLRENPEYRDAARCGVGPEIISGSSDSRAGKVFVDMTGGTEGPREVMEKLSAAGVGTIVGMHMSEDHLKEAKKQHFNVVIAGHISSDNLGMNLLLDAAEARLGELSVIECSGFRRFRRR
jgi:hypothetical protein